MLEFMSSMDQEAKLLTWVIRKNKKWIKMKIEKILRLCEKQMNDMGCHFLCVPSYRLQFKKEEIQMGKVWNLQSQDRQCQWWCTRGEISLEHVRIHNPKIFIYLFMCIMYLCTCISDSDLQPTAWFESRSLNFNSQKKKTVTAIRIPVISPKCLPISCRLLCLVLWRNNWKLW